jgi:photosystem II stability/assembly factor-like uncharacterized protein
MNGHTPDSDIEAKLSRYYRSLDSQPMSILSEPTFSPRARTERKFHLLPRIALASLASLAVVAGVVIPRLAPAIPAAVNQITDPPITLDQNGRVDRAGLSRSGEVWAVRGATLFTTTDQGDSWRSSAFPVTWESGTQPILDIASLDSDRFWVAALDRSSPSGSAIVVYRTADGGKTWTRSSDPLGCQGPAVRLAMTDPSTGYLDCGGSIFRTDDSGRTWAATGPCGDGGSLVYASDKDTIWRASAKTLVGPGTLLSVSRDGGRTCTSVALPFLDVVPPNAILSVPVAPAFSDPKHGVVVVSVDIPQSSPEVRYFSTSDGGHNWVVAIRQIAYHNIGVASVAEGPVFVSLAANDMWTSADAGANWQRWRFSGLPSGGAFLWVGFSDSHHAAGVVASGSDKTLMVTSDGGLSWHAVDLSR